MRDTRCWNCGKVSNSQANVEDGGPIEPENGDVSFCFYCGSLAIFDDSYPDAVRKPSPSELDELNEKFDLWLLKEVWKMSHS